MAVTPLDILQKRFGPARRGGYEPEEVHKFLDEARESLEACLRENLRLREELDARETELARLRSEGDEVKDALILARRLVSEMETTARREADLLLGEARLEVERILESAHEEERVLQDHLMRLKSARLHHLAQHRALLDTQLRMLDELEGPG
jgi:DivIVA domain-containing protein